MSCCERRLTRHNGHRFSLLPPTNLVARMAESVSLLGFCAPWVTTGQSVAFSSVVQEPSGQSNRPTK